MLPKLHECRVQDGLTMVRIYIDIETYRPQEECSFVEEKIVSVGLLIDETPYQEDSLNVEVEPVLLNEWNGMKEHEIVAKVQDHIRMALSSHRFTVIVGFNILRFDIPLLLCKSVQHSLGKHEEVSKMWHNCFTIDYFQQLLAANGNRFKGLTLDKIVKVAKDLGLKSPPYNTVGADIKELYEKGDYDKIEEHLKRDLMIVRWLDLCAARRLIEKAIREGKALFRE